MRTLLLWMAGNAFLRRTLPRLWFARRAVRRFMPGERPEDALDAASKFSASGTGVLFTRLGENIINLDEAAATAAAYAALAAEIDHRGLDAELSVKLTQLGFDIDEEATMGHVAALAGQAAQHGRTLWLDMEGSAYTERTIAFYERLKARHPSAGVCLQAYLHRTAADIERLLPLEPRIRLVKGAYAEPPDVALQSRRDVNANFIALATAVLDAAAAGRRCFLGLGTHDVALVEQLAEHAQAIGLPRSAFDVEMLYGIRTDQQRRLAAAGYRVRVLIAYGEAWYPWYMRRLAERPANVIFALRQLLPF
jgi:proline dehydrogenase